MNLDELRAVQDREREKDSLQHLRDSFYEEVGTYIADLRAERERHAERTDDPFADPEVRRLTDEIETAEEVAESIYERRMGKVVKTASLAAAGYTAETDGLTAEEADLFDDLVERIEANQEAVLDVLSGRASSAPSGRSAPGDDGDGASAAGDDFDGATATGDDIDDGPDPTAASGSGSAPDDGDAGSASAADAMGGSSAADAANPDASRPDAPSDDPASPSGELDAPGASNSDSEADSETDSDADDVPPAPPDELALDSGGDGSGIGSDEVAEDDDGVGDFEAGDGLDADRITVRVTDDVGEIVGVDGTAYDLATDTVVELPEENALPLLEKDAATRVE